MEIRSIHIALIAMLFFAGMVGVGLKLLITTMIPGFGLLVGISFVAFCAATIAGVELADP